ncbi:MAG: MFS transporter [Marinilabiliales bacterium]|nr:MAG: MFS transporter [Marinilabiliales bacterium]
MIKNILEIPSGIIADALGRRKTLIVSFMFYILSFLIFYFSDSYVVLILAISFFAIGDAFRTGTNKAMIYDYLDQNGWSKQKINYYGNTRSWSQMGSALSSLIEASIVIAFQDYTIIFLASIVPYLINSLIILSYPKSLEGEIHDLNSGKILDAFKTTFKNLWITFKNTEYWKIINLHAAHSGFHKAIKEYIQPVIVLAVVGLSVFNSWSNERREALFIGLIYFVIYLLSSFTSKRSGKFVIRFISNEKALLYTLLIGLSLGVMVGLSLYFKLEWLAIGFFVLIYMNENLRKPIGVSAVAEKSDQKVMASALSINSQAESFYAAIIAPILGLVIDKINIGTGIFIVSIMLIIITITLNILKNE